MLDGVSNLQDLARVTVMGDINDPIYAYFNPSIAYDGKGKLRIVIRACTFRPIPGGTYDYRDGSNYSKTKLMYGYIDPITYEVTDLKELGYCKDTPSEIVRSGLEDARLYWRKDGMHFIGVHVDTRPEHRYPPQQAEFIYNETTDQLKYIRTMFGESPARGEKNWLPTDKPSKLFEYNYSPTQVIKEGVKLEGVRYAGFIHGSSQLIYQPKTKTYLAVLHSKHADPLVVGRVYDKMLYVHYMAEYNAEGYLIKLSDPFTLGLADNIEFVSGMVEHGDDLLMSFGAGDARWGMARISKDRATNLLKPYAAIEREPIKELTRPQHKYITFQQLEQRQLARR